MTQDSNEKVTETEVTRETTVPDPKEEHRVEATEKVVEKETTTESTGPV